MRTKRASQCSKSLQLFQKKRVTRDLRIPSERENNNTFDKEKRNTKGYTASRTDSAECVDGKITAACLQKAQFIVSSFTLFAISLHVNTFVTDYTVR